ncbi:MAG TPA: hypothetical protein VE987_22485 [Polyangiaceae bacterium]|nr:hypothetical protein [Polyangiaceae bacterium]
MQDSFVPLIVAAGAFLAGIVWRVRPAVRTRRRVSREAWRQAQARIEEAPDGPARARALCDAADLAAAQVRGGGRASALYLRAIRSDPGSVEVVARAVAALGRRPHGLETLLWRRLALIPWEQSREATRASLDALRSLYEGPLRSGVRARAIAHAREMV